MIGIKEEQVSLCPLRGKSSLEALHGSGGGGLQKNEIVCITSTVQP